MHTGASLMRREWAPTVAGEQFVLVAYQATRRVLLFAWNILPSLD